MWSTGLPNQLECPKKQQDDDDDGEDEMKAMRRLDDEGEGPRAIS